ncbi:cystathionine beta-synthase [Georgenia sp. 10Sc9-8]|uniref:Cystathionine beta-synthase n=1 Tax=Georgenia halotolerans TaxID=3028317 RepID=A0ABT5U3G0_9MICO|nr:cystathionine beta-synthase [Georgenia halotolerans]
MTYVDAVADLVGGTPLVRLHHVTEGIAATVLVKLEYLNPGGSVKDRIAAKMVETAEAEGLLRPGGTIVEPTSGNTGVGLALAAQRKGYRCVFVAPDKVGKEKLDVLRAYGAEVVVTPSAVPPDSPESYYGVSDRLVREIPGAYKPDQFSNPGAPQSHYETTGPEIWADTAGQVTHVVIGVGTGGTITGAGRYLKEVSAGAVQVIGVDPVGSVYSGGTGRPYLVEGVGEDMWPANYDPDLPDAVLAVDDAESFAMTRRLAAEEAMLLGGSSGMAVTAALRVAADLPADAVVVVLAPDSGRGYLGKIYDDRWMLGHGFAPAGDGPSVADVLGEPAALPHVPREATLAEAVALLHEHDADRLPVLAAPPPARLGEVRGAVSATGLAHALLDGAASSAPVTDHLDEPLGTVGATEPVSVLRERLTVTEALLVLAGGDAVGLVTRAHLLAHARSQENR